MKYFIPAFVALFLLMAASSLRGQPVTDVQKISRHYGAWDSTAQESVTVSSAMGDSTQYGKPVMVSGEIADVCRKKGCWLVISDGTAQMRVTFKDYGFFVPTTSSGKSVMIQGVVSVEEIPEDLAKHYASESEGEDPDAIEGAQKVITMVATGVEITTVAAE